MLSFSNENGDEIKLFNSLVSLKTALSKMGKIIFQENHPSNYDKLIITEYENGNINDDDIDIYGTYYFN